MKTKYISGNQAASITRKSSSPLRKEQQLELPSTQSETVPPDGSVFDQILGETPTAPVHEPLLKKRQLAKHYGVCDRTIERWVTADMPRHYVGKRQMRFRLSEVQVWLQQNHIDRFAAHGIAMTAAEVKRRVVNIPILNGLEIVQVSQTATPLNKPAHGNFVAHAIPMTAAEVKRRSVKIPIVNGLEIVQVPQTATPLNKPAQGNALGPNTTKTLALKGQHNASTVTPKCKTGRKRKSGCDVPCDDNGHKYRTSRYTRTCAVCGRTEERDPSNNWTTST